jgi:dTDP-4-amino-4,6-dideoxygalactose transaminase
MKVPFVDLKKQYINIQTDIDVAIKNVIEETAFIGGNYVNEFEQEFAKLYGVKHCLSVANGTDSLYITMKMLNIGINDEVITVANSWISTSETITQTGAKPVFVDIDPDYFTINEEKIRSAITKNTKAIIPVHLFGQACDMKLINGIAEEYNLLVIEDCAQSHFSEFNGQRVGTFGIASSFSFYPGKNLGAYGDAGCVLTNSDELALKIKMFSRHGALKKHEHIMEGINSRLDGLQASILTAKLPYILKWTQQRREKADLYRKYLANIEQIILPLERENTYHSYHLFVIRAFNRNKLMKFLQENEIEVAVHYPVALPNMKAYSYLGHEKSDFPIASEYQDLILSLPIYPEISEGQIKYVADKIREFYKLI